jgi:hypothetical protein
MTGQQDGPTQIYLGDKNFRTKLENVLYGDGVDPSDDKSAVPACVPKRIGEGYELWGILDQVLFVMKFSKLSTYDGPYGKNMIMKFDRASEKDENDSDDKGICSVQANNLEILEEVVHEAVFRAKGFPVVKKKNSSLSLWPDLESVREVKQAFVPVVSDPQYKGSVTAKYVRSGPNQTGVFSSSKAWPETGTHVKGTLPSVGAQDDEKPRGTAIMKASVIRGHGFKTVDKDTNESHTYSIKIGTPQIYMEGVAKKETFNLVPLLKGGM